MKKIAVLFILCIFPGFLMAQEGAPDTKASPDKTTRSVGNTNSAGVMADFRSLEEELKGRKRDDKVMKKRLEANLLRALTNSMARRFYAEMDKFKKDLKVENIKYDNPTSPFVYYVKYTTQNYTFVARCDYSRDPAFYLQDPLFVKLLVREPGQKESESGASETKVQ